jgi:hypothetical protein
MFGRKEQSLGEMLNAPEAPKSDEVTALETAAAAGDTAAARKLEGLKSNERQEVSFNDWDKKAAASGENATQMAGQVKDKVKGLFGSLMGRIKKGVGWAATAPEMVKYGAVSAKEAVGNAGNVDYNRNLNSDGGKMENFLSSLDDKKDQAYEWSKEKAQENFTKYKGEVVKLGANIDSRVDSGMNYIDNRVDNSVKKFKNFLTYHSPAQRRLRAKEATQVQVEALKVSEKNVMNVTAEDFMKLLKACEKTGVPITGVRVEIGSNPSRYERQSLEPKESLTFILYARTKYSFGINQSAAGGRFSQAGVAR